MVLGARAEVIRMIMLRCLMPVAPELTFSLGIALVISRSLAAFLCSC